MPSAKWTSFLPVIVASAAAGGGILGAFVAVGLVATPPKSAPPVAQETKAVAPIVKPVKAAETTGSAPAADGSGAACDGQTWPYLSRPCMEEWQRKNRNVRVISTDKLNQPTVNAIEAPAAPAGDTNAPTTTAAGSAPASSEPMPVATTEPWFNPATLAAPITPPPAAQEAPKATTTAAAPDKATETKQATTKDAAKDSKEAAKDSKDATKAAAAEDVKEKPKHVATKAKRKAKSPRFEDDDDANAVAASDDDRAPRDRADRSSRSRRQVVQTERDDVPADDGRGRRVVVIHRGGGLFENLFGMNRGRDYDDDD